MRTSISVITPAYNRAHLLKRCYESLKKQTFKNIEWVITDDGSTDDTKNTVDEFIKEGIIKIKYIYQENAGQAKALNTCIENAEMELCSKLDSDDYLNEDALEKIAAIWDKNRSDAYCGVLARRYIAGTNLLSGCKPVPGHLKAATMEALYQKYGIAKDTQFFATYVTKIAKKFPYPVISGEKRMPPSWLYSRFAVEGYKFLILDEPIYAWDMQKDGITHNMNQKNNMIKNIDSCIIFYKQTTHPVFTYKTRLKSMAFYVYLLLNKKKSIFHIAKSAQYPFIFLFSLPLTVFLYFKFGKLFKN